jgi:hypothetical protein
LTARTALTTLPFILDCASGTTVPVEFAAFEQPDLAGRHSAITASQRFNGKRVSAHRPSGAEAECVGATATPCSETVVPSIQRRDRTFYQNPLLM